MSKHPVIRSQRALRDAETGEVEVIRPADSFFSFRYSRTEISVAGAKARVKSRQTRLQDGKITTETFDGDVDRAVYDRMVDDAQRYFLSQMALFTKSLSWLLPLSRKPGSDHD
jgi:hypothetical protein